MFEQYILYLYDLGGLGGNRYPSLSLYGGGSGAGARLAGLPPPNGGGLDGKAVGGRSSRSSRPAVFGGNGGGGSLRGSVPSGTSFISNGIGSSPVH